MFRWRHFAGEIILWAVRWYCRYGISYRELEVMRMFKKGQFTTWIDAVGGGTEVRFVNRLFGL